MNLINKILILIILIFMINYLSNGKIINIIKNALNTCKTNVENFMGLTYKINNIKSNVPNIPYQLQKDFPYNNHNDIDNLDEETYNLYKFLNSMITVNINTYELTPSDNTKIKVSDKFKKEIYDQIKKMFNCRDYNFNDITFLSELYYYNNNRGKEIEPFEFKSNITYKKKSIGTVIIYMECFLREDKFYYQTNQTGFLTIQNIKLINRTYPDGMTKDKVWKSAFKLIPTNKQSQQSYQSQQAYQDQDSEINLEIKDYTNDNKFQKQAIKQNNDLTNKMVESFTDHFVDRDDYNDLFIKPTVQKHVTFQNDTEDSLIPSNIEFSTCG